MVCFKITRNYYFLIRTKILKISSLNDIILKKTIFTLVILKKSNFAIPYLKNNLPYPWRLVKVKNILTPLKLSYCVSVMLNSSRKFKKKIFQNKEN